MLTCQVNTTKWNWNKDQQGLNNIVRDGLCICMRRVKIDFNDQSLKMVSTEGMHFGLNLWREMAKFPVEKRGTIQAVDT